MKRFLILYILLLSKLDVHSQSYEQKAMEFFCDRIYTNSSELQGLDIYFKNRTYKYKSYYYYVAHCFKDVNLFEEFPEGFSEKTFEIISQPETNREDYNNCNRFRKRKKLFKRNQYELQLRSAMLYGEEVIVEIRLFNKKQNTYDIYVVRFHEGKAIDYCNTWFVFD